MSCDKSAPSTISDNVSSRTRSKSRQRANKSTNVQNQRNAVVVNVQMADQIGNGEEQTPVDDIDVWSDASGDAQIPVMEKSMEENILNETSEEQNVMSPENDNPESILQTMVRFIAPLGEKMDLVRQEVSDMKTAIRMEFQDELQKMEAQIKGTNDRMDRFDRFLLEQQTLREGNGEPTSLSAEAPPFVPRETPAPTTVHEQTRYSQKVPRYDGSAV